MTRDRGHEPTRPTVNLHPHATAREARASSWSPYPTPPGGTHVPRETDASLRTRIAEAYGRWGAFLSVVMESSGAALDACAAHVGLERKAG